MKFTWKSVRYPVQVSFYAGLVLLAAAVSLTSAGADTPGMSIFPEKSSGAQPAPAADTPAEENLNLDIGRLDRSGRAPDGDQAQPRELPPPAGIPGPAVPPPAGRTQRVDIRVNVPRERNPIAELESAPLLPLPEGVTLGENDVLAKSALTEIPKGEGYEATVSANSQGKLILLGRQKYDENGEPLLDDDGNPVMIPMHRGMEVKEGEILGVQYNQAAHARRTAAERELEVAKKEAGKQLEVEVAEASKNVALMEYKRAVNSNKRVPNSISEDEIWQKRFEWYRGQKSEDKARYDLEIAALAVDVKEAAIAVADADLEERLIRSPLSGQVDDIFKNKGEWLREGDNVLHVLRLDKINITADFDSEVVTPSMIQGKAVTVYVTKAGLDEPQKLDGVITYARPVLMMNRFVAYAEVKNTQIDGGWVLLPGMRVNLIVHKDKDADPAEFAEKQE